MKRPEPVSSGSLSVSAAASALNTPVRCRSQPRDDMIVTQMPVQQQHLDQRAGAVILRRCRAGAEGGRVHPPADRRLPTAYPYIGLSRATVVTAVRADAGSATRLAHILCMVRQ